MEIILTESQIQKLISEEVELAELRKSHMRFVSDKVKSVTGQEWPDYVLNDWLYKNTKDFDPKWDTKNSYMGLVERQVKIFLKMFGKGQWKLQKIKINNSVFTPSTNQQIDNREGGTKNPYKVENDFERFMTQQQLLSSKGKVSDEPIIVVKRPDGLELLEGWHRTITYLRELGEYEQNTYIYYPN